MKTDPDKSVLYSDLCFACGEKNPIGLKLKFRREGKGVRTDYTPDKMHQGWADIIHGGLITTVLDEAMAYAAGYWGVKCVTATVETRFRRPLSVGEPTIVTAWVSQNRRRLIETKARMTLVDGTLVAECIATQFVAGEFEPIEKK